MLKNGNSKIILSSIVTVLIPVIFMLTLISLEKSDISRTAAAEAIEQSKRHALCAAQTAYSLCENRSELLEKLSQANLNVALQMIENRVFLDSALIEWKIFEFSNSKERSIRLPGLIYVKASDNGNIKTTISPNYEKSVYTPLIDDIANLAGGAFAIFQKTNESADMLMIASNITDSNAKRIIGSYIKAVDDNGIRNKIIEAVLAGKQYSEKVLDSDAPRSEIYAPLKDGAGNIIGMICSGTVPESSDGLKKAFSKISIGKTGRMFALAGNGRAGLRYIIATQSDSDAADSFDVTDITGRPAGVEIIESAKKAGGEPIFYKYNQRGTDGETSQLRLASLIYFKKWDWIIGAEISPGEFMRASDAINASVDKLSLNSIYAAVFSIALSLLVTIIIARKTSESVAEISSNSIADDQGI